MFGRGVRAETRSKAKEDIKRVANAIHKVRTWEKKWVAIGETTMKVLKWVPAANQASRSIPKSTLADSLNSSNINQHGKDIIESQPASEISSVPKRMLSYMNDENSMDSVASSNTSDNIDEHSRDSQNYVSDSSRSAVNFDTPNSGTPTLSMMRNEETLDNSTNSYLQDDATAAQPIPPHKDDQGE